MDMDQELKTRLVGFLDTLTEGVKGAGDFAAEQAPLVVQEWLNWIFWSSTIIAIASITCAVVGFVVALKLVKPVCASWDKCDNAILGLGGGAVMVAGFIASITLPIVAAANSLTAIQVAVAPRVVLLEKIADLIK